MTEPAHPLTDLDQLVDYARAAHETAVSKRRAVLVDAQWPIDSTDVLNLFYELTEREDEEVKPANTQDPLLTGAFYWAQPTDELEIAGIGEAIRITSKAPTSAFETMKKASGIALEHHTCACHAPAWAKPRWVGAFAFDSSEHRDVALGGAWARMPGAALIRPRLMLVRREVYTWLTVSQMIGPNDDPAATAERMIGWRDLVRSAAKRAKKRIPKLASTSAKAPIPKDVAADAAATPTQAAIATSGEDQRFLDAVQQALTAIGESDLTKVVLARAVDVPLPVKMVHSGLLDWLRQHHPMCTTFYYAPSDAPAFVGATPERLVTLTPEAIRVQAVAGTAPRGQDDDEDTSFATAMSSSEKERAEHRHVVEAIVESLAPHAAAVAVAPNSPVVLPLENAQHLVTHLRGTPKPNTHIMDLVEALHPTPAVGGAPTDKAQAFIREHEPISRGLFAGPVGIVDDEGHGEFIVAIRSGVIASDGLTLYAGAGIVAGSTPDAELRETALKLRAILDAFGTDS